MVKMTSLSIALRPEFLGSVKFLQLLLLSAGQAALDMLLMMSLQNTMKRKVAISAPTELNQGWVVLVAANVAWNL